MLRGGPRSAPDVEDTGECPPPRPAPCTGPGEPALTLHAAPVSRRRLASGREDSVDQSPGVPQDPVEVLLALEALGVEFVDLLGARRSGREPAARHDLEAADRRRRSPGAAVSMADRLAGQTSTSSRPGTTGAASAAFFCGRGRSVDALVGGLAELARQVAVEIARIAAGHGGHLGRQQREDDAVLVGRPDRAVAAQERGARALLSAESEGRRRAARPRTT